jgi:H+/gluconate symporter-like permease
MSDTAILINTAVAILAIVVLIVRFKLNPLIALVIGCLYLGLATGLRPDWLTPSAFATVVRLADGLLAELGEPNRSRANEGAHASATAFPWAL